MRPHLALVLWLFTAQSSALQCQGTVCRPLPGTDTVHMIVSTFPTQESCDSVRRQMPATGTVVMQTPTKQATSVRQTTTSTCQQGE